MAIAHVIFDCDGVLVDSEPLSGGILVQRLNAEGLPWAEEDVDRDFLGRSWAANIEVIEERYGPMPAGFSDRYHAELFAAFERELRPVPGIEAALDAIDLPSCVASSGEHARIRHTLRVTGLLERFDGRIFSVEDVEHGKPAPDLFLYAAESMGFDRARCAVVEDSPAGVQAGRAAGMTVFGYAGRSSPDVLRAAGARVFGDMWELPDLIAGG
jgi:HAD superfamily hydrolase (TIGR01509 family)